MSAVHSGRVKVGIADFVISSDESAPTTNDLGSCIGAVLYDPKTGVSGLEHAIPPEADGGNKPAKFVDTGVELLTAEMQTVGADTDRIIAKVAGGSTMFDFTPIDGDGSIGDRNVAATRTTPDRSSIDIVVGDVGGPYGRSLELNSEAGDPRARSARNGTHVL